MTTNIKFIHKRELLLAKYGIVRELSILTKSLLSAQHFEAATAIAERLDANTEAFATELSELELFDSVVFTAGQDMKAGSAVTTETPPFVAIAMAGAAQVPPNAEHVEVAVNTEAPVV